MQTRSRIYTVVSLATIAGVFLLFLLFNNISIKFNNDDDSERTKINKLTKILIDFSMELVDADIAAGQLPTIPPSKRFCDSDNKLAIIIPYRNRATHLKMAIKWLRNHLLHQFDRYALDTSMSSSSQLVNVTRGNIVCSFAGFFVIEQDNERPFNRGWLLNVGSVISHEKGANVLVYHDVDTLPVREVEYLVVPDHPTQLSSEIDRFGFQPPYPKNAGGVTLLTYDQFVKLNGFSNHYEGWGAEDDDFLQRMVFAGMIEQDAPMYRPLVGKGVFFTLEDKYHTERDKSNLKKFEQKLKKLESGRKDLWINDGLSTLTYKLTNTSHIEVAEDVFHYKVTLKKNNKKVD